jgi:hypothetical protein
LLRLQKRSHALTYLPSMLLLAAFTDVSSDIAEGYSLGAWWWVLPLVLAVWLLVVLLARSLQEVEPVESCGLFSRPMWINLFVMLVLILGILQLPVIYTISRIRTVDKMED